MRPMVGSKDRERRRTTDFVEVNDAVYKWYCLARQFLDYFYKKLCRVSMQIPNLKHQMAGLIVYIKQMTGECANVQEETVSKWYERL